MLEYCTVYTGDTEVSFQTLLVSWKQSFVRGRTQIPTFAKTQIGNKKTPRRFHTELESSNWSHLPLPPKQTYQSWG